VGRNIVYNEYMTKLFYCALVRIRGTIPLAGVPLKSEIGLKI